MAEPMTIRALTPGDAAAYLALRVEMVRACPTAFAAHPDEVDATAPDKLIPRIAAPPHNMVFGAFDGDRLIGTAGYYTERRIKMRHKGAIWGVYTDPAYRGRGLARAMILQALAHAAEHVRIVMISAGAGSTEALALYRSLGFVEWGREPMAICVDGRMHDETHLAIEVGGDQP